MKAVATYGERIGLWMNIVRDKLAMQHGASLEDFRDYETVAFDSNNQNDSW